MLGGNECHPKGDVFGKRVSDGGTKCLSRCYSSAARENDVAHSL